MTSLHQASSSLSRGDCPPTGQSSALVRAWYARPASVSSSGTAAAPLTGDAEGTCPPRRRYRGPAVVRAGLLAVGWLIVAVLGLVALLRLVAWDSAEPLVVLDAATLFVYLPAWAVACRFLIEGVALADIAKIEGFGRSEQILGRSLAEERDSAFLMTKFYPTFPVARVPEQRAVAMCGRLGTHPLDLYQVHQPFPDPPAWISWKETSRPPRWNSPTTSTAHFSSFRPGSALLPGPDSYTARSAPYSGDAKDRRGRWVGDC